jgi:hypothetical protein
MGVIRSGEGVVLAQGTDANDSSHLGQTEPSPTLVYYYYYYYYYYKLERIQKEFVALCYTAFLMAYTTINMKTF